MKRREFIKTSALTAAAVAATPLTVDAKKDKPKVKAYRPLGKTGMKISDISFGAGRLTSGSLVLRAIDRGMNYIDTAPDYGKSEDYIGEVMNKIQRDKVFIASKFCKPGKWSHLRFGATKKEYIEVVENSLTRMKTDYLDVCLVHGIGGSSKDIEEAKKSLLDENMLRAADELKKAGKIRSLGVSSHGPHNMEDLLLMAVQSGHYDMIMPAFNFMQFPKLSNLLKEAQKKQVGVIAMKTLAGAKKMDLETGDLPFEQAALKWVLAHKEVAGLVIGIKNIANLDLYLPASGEKMTTTDQKLLKKYARTFGRQYCRTGCNACGASCPAGVPIATTLRYQMYFKDYEMEKRAMESYEALDAPAKACETCTERSCIDACPFGLPINDLLCEAHHSLTFSA